LIAGQTDELAIGARQAFRDEANTDPGSWMNLPFWGSLFSPENSPEWVRRGWLTASVINPTTADVALAMMVRAIQTNTQPPERTVLAPTSYPEIEKLSDRPVQNSWINRLQNKRYRYAKGDEGESTKVALIELVCRTVFHDVKY